MVRTHFVNFLPSALREASALSSLQFSPFFTDPTNFAGQLTFTNAQQVYFGKHAGIKDKLGADGYRSTVFRDIDGSVTGIPNVSVVFDTPLYASGACMVRPHWNARICNAPFGSLFLVNVDGGSPAPRSVRVANVETPETYLTLYGNPTVSHDAIYQTNVPGDSAVRVTFASAFPRHLRIGLHHLLAGVNVRVILPQAPAGAVVRDGTNVMSSARRFGEPLVIDLVSGDARGRKLDICATDPCG